MKKLIFGFLFFTCLGLTAQELNCTVTINTSQIQSSDKKIYETMQTQLKEFMNQRRWTSDQFLNQERIDCSILINITDRPSTDQFKATMTINSRRPIYKSSYNSTILNYQDNDFNFN